MRERHWCQRCDSVLRAPCSQHESRAIGHDLDVEVVVMDRSYGFDVQKHGFRNNSSAAVATGRTPRQHEAATRATIDEMRKSALQARREKRDGEARVVGAVPAAMLFGMKRQYGDSVLQDPRHTLKELGLWWG